MTAPRCCDFCYRRPVSQLRRGRRALLDVVLRRPAPTTFVCELHTGKGLDYIRSQRWRLALLSLRAFLLGMLGTLISLVVATLMLAYAATVHPIVLLVRKLSTGAVRHGR